MSAVTPDEVRSFLLESLDGPLESAGVDPAEISDDFDLHERGIIDSLGLLELIAGVEEHFGVEVDFEELDPDRLTVLGPFCQYVAERAVPAPG